MISGNIHDYSKTKSIVFRFIHNHMIIKMAYLMFLAKMPKMRVQKPRFYEHRQKWNAKFGNISISLWKALYPEKGKLNFPASFPNEFFHVKNNHKIKLKAIFFSSTSSIRKVPEIRINAKDFHYSFHKFRHQKRDPVEFFHSPFQGLFSFFYLVSG